MGTCTLIDDSALKDCGEPDAELFSPPRVPSNGPDRDGIRAADAEVRAGDAPARRRPAVFIIGHPSPEQSLLLRDRRNVVEGIDFRQR